jgi:hypothetical protein
MNLSYIKNMQCGNYSVAFAQMTRRISFSCRKTQTTSSSHSYRITYLQIHCSNTHSLLNFIVKLRNSKYASSLWFIQILTFQFAKCHFWIFLCQNVGVSCTSYAYYKFGSFKIPCFN